MKNFPFIEHLRAWLRLGDRAHPERDWFALVTVVALVLAVLVVWNLWAFDTVAGGGTIGSATSAPAPVVNRSSLDTVQKIFSDRATEESKYETGVYQFTDPSQ